MTEQYFREPNLAPSDAVRQHYVPRMHLARFVGQDGLQGYDLLDNREFQSSVANVGVETRFYDLQIDGKILSTEKWLADVEGAAAPVIARMLAEPASIQTLSESEEFSIARFLSAQIFRVPAFRQWHDSVQTDVRGQIKDFAKEYLRNTLSPEQFRDQWSVWESKPDWWWSGQAQPSQEGDISTFMLGEIQGFANLLRAMSWRIGNAHPRFALYTSDNPMSGYLPPVRPWWSTGAFTEHVYYLPLSTRVLFNTDPKLHPSGVGKREYLDFSEWETSFARHVVTRAASRFLFGPAPYVQRDWAISWLRRIDAIKVQDAIRLQGFNPNRPPVELPAHLAPEN